MIGEPYAEGQAERLDAAASSHLDALIVLDDLLTYAYRSRIVEFATNNGLIANYVESPTTFDFPINLRTAHALGLTIPEGVGAEVTELIDAAAYAYSGELHLHNPQADFDSATGHPAKEAYS